MIATVTKRRIVNKYKPTFEKRGYVVEDLNFIHPMESNVAYDPLQYISSYSDITFLAESIVRANPRKDKSSADPYWDEAATSLLSAEIAYTLMTKDNATFADVLELHDGIDFRENGGQITTSLDQANLNTWQRKTQVVSQFPVGNPFTSSPSKQQAAFSEH